MFPEMSRFLKSNGSVYNFGNSSLSFDTFTNNGVHTSNFTYCEIIQDDMPVSGSSDKVRIIYTRLGRLHTISVYCTTREKIFVEGDDDCRIPLANNKELNIANALAGKPEISACFVVHNDDEIEVVSRSLVVSQGCIFLETFEGEYIPNFSVSFNC